MINMPQPPKDLLERAIADWTRRQGGSELLAQWAAKAAAADLAGNSAVAMSAEERAQIAGEPLMQCADAPFVVELDHFYLRRNRTHEQGVALAIQSRLLDAKTNTPLEPAVLDRLFAPRPDGADLPQRQAVAAVAGQNLFVLTGGPGTGKTTTVLRMLVRLDEAFRQAHERAPRIACCAPTGKAAQRLSQALRAGADELLMRAADAGLRSATDNILRHEPTTVHRYVGELSRDVRIRADIVVLDEASMLDLAMMHRLLMSLDADTQLVLVGDPNQLTSVETGSVFSDLVRFMRASNSPALVELTHSFRAIPQLQALNDAAGAGDGGAFEYALQSSDGHSQRIDLADPGAFKAALSAWAEDIGEALSAADAFSPLPADADAERAAILNAHRSVAERQLLCAVHQGAFGTRECNAVIETAIRKLAHVEAESVWYPGRAVLISQNDYALGLFNGDVGLCLDNAAGERKVWFLRAGADGVVAPMGLSTQTLPAHVCAFAMSIHKSQGSEYPEVAVLLPADSQTELLTRELLYTAVSRAKRRLQLWTSDTALNTALQTHVARVGALQRRLSS